MNSTPRPRAAHCISIVILLCALVCGSGLSREESSASASSLGAVPSAYQAATPAAPDLPTYDPAVATTVPSCWRGPGYVITQKLWADFLAGRDTCAGDPIPTPADGVAAASTWNQAQWTAQDLIGNIRQIHFPAGTYTLAASATLNLRASASGASGIVIDGELGDGGVTIQRQAPTWTEMQDTHRSGQARCSTLTVGSTCNDSPPTTMDLPVFTGAPLLSVRENVSKVVVQGLRLDGGAGYSAAPPSSGSPMLSSDQFTYLFTNPVTSAFGYVKMSNATGIRVGLPTAHSGTRPTDVAVRSTTVRNTHGDGVYISYSDKVVIEDDTIEWTGRNAVGAIEGDNVSIHDNVLGNVAHWNIDVEPNDATTSTPRGPFDISRNAFHSANLMDSHACSAMASYPSWPYCFGDGIDIGVIPNGNVQLGDVTVDRNTSDSSFQLTVRGNGTGGSVGNMVVTNNQDNPSATSSTRTHSYIMIGYWPYTGGIARATVAHAWVADNVLSANPETTHPDHINLTSCDQRAVNNHDAGGLPTSVFMEDVPAVAPSPSWGVPVPPRPSLSGCDSLPLSDRLHRGDVLTMFESIRSANGRYEAVLRPDGSLSVVDMQQGGAQVPGLANSSPTNTVPAELLVGGANWGLDLDLTIVAPTSASDSTPQIKWLSWTAGGGPDIAVVMQDDGNLVVRTGDGRTVWSSFGGTTGDGYNVVGVGRSLTPGQRLVSPNGQFETVVQADGDLVTRTLPSGPVVFASGTGGHSGCSLSMGQNGIASINCGGAAVWQAPGGSPVAGSWLELHDDGKLVIVKGAGTPSWVSP